MKKVNITLAFDDEKLDALEFSLRKENTSAQAKMDEALRQLYEKTVPEPVREYLDSKAAPVIKAKRPPKPKPTVAEQKSPPSAIGSSILMSGKDGG